MKQYKRFLAGVISVGMVAGLLSGCGNEKPAKEDGDSEGKTLLKVQVIGDFKTDDFTDPISGKSLKGLHVLEEEFERLHEDIDLEYIVMGWDDYQKKTQSMMIAGEADVYQAPGIGALADQGLLEPLQPYIDRDNFDLSVYMDGQVDGWKVAGPEDTEPQIYGLPFIADTRYICYDKQLFDEWGVEYLSATPTLDEILEKAAKMTGTNPVSGKQNYGIFHNGLDAADTVMNLNEYFGGTWGTGNRSNEMQVFFNTDTMVQAIDALIELNKLAPDGVMANQGGENFGSAENNIAIHMRCHPAILNNIQAQGLDDRYGISRLFINEEEGMGGMFAGSPVVIAASSEVKDAAWEYIKFVSSDFFAQYFWENQRNEGLPCQKVALTFDDVKNNENILAMLDSVQYLWTPRYVYRAGQARSILITAVEDAALNGKTATEVLEAAQKSANEWIAAQ